MADQALADDLLRGADKIALFVFGSASARRKIYYLATEQKSGNKFPAFHLGNTLCARRSTLMRWIADQERGGVNAPG